jgi:hypothetical protein
MSHKTFCSICPFKLGCYAPIFHAFKTTCQYFQAHLHCFIFLFFHLKLTLIAMDFFPLHVLLPFSFVKFNSFYLVVLFLLMLTFCSCFLTLLLFVFFYAMKILSSLSTFRSCPPCFFSLLHYMNVHIVHCVINELILSANFFTCNEFFEN